MTHRLSHDFGTSWGRSSVPAPTIISIIISIIIIIIIAIIVGIIISIMVSMITIVTNVNSLIVNVSTISLIYTSSINDIRYSIYMVVQTALPFYRIIIILYWISLMLLVWMSLMVLTMILMVILVQAMLMMVSHAKPSQVKPY